MKHILPALACATLVVGSIGSAYARDDAASRVKALHWEEGPTTSKVGHIATQKVKGSAKFVGGRDAVEFLELLGNLTSGNELGILLSDSGTWFACYEFDDIGYVRDDEKSSLDSDDILRQLKEAQRDSNPERRRRGLSEMEVIGWVSEPHYDETTHNLEWGFKIKSDDGISVNYNTKVLGRNGVMNVTLVCDPSDFQKSLREFKTALKGFEYTAGNRYSEYRQGDKLSEYGLTALIVGGAAAAAVKSGALKWIWKVLVVVFVAIGGFFKKLFGGNKDND